MSRQYITTAIDYANAAPHMGHVMEKIMADVVARWFRLRGDSVLFQIGMDEHGIKIQETAERQQMTPAALVEKMAPVYRSLYERLGISFDRFIRTSDRAVHWPTVLELWKRLQAAGALEKRTYTGYYCLGCERFMTKRDLIDGKCQIHNAVPKEVTEENWFFLLKREGKWLKSLLTKDEGGYRIIPSSRAQEVLALIEQGLEDVSFSRPKTSLSWGIPVPGDPDQVMYVWCDALTNYISGLGLLTDHADAFFWDGAEVTHVIGKDIARFHALIWPAMLKTAGVRTPDRLLMHGFVTSEGQKMSKTIGNVVDPEDVLKRFAGNPDPLRLFLSFGIPVGLDGDFSYERLDDFYNFFLRDSLGNLLNRVMVLLKKDGSERQAHFGEDICNTVVRWLDYQNCMHTFKLDAALATVNGMLIAREGEAIGLNKIITTREPWKLQGVEKSIVLWQLAEDLRHIALMLLPFIPDTAYRISKQLNVPYAEKMLSKDFVITDELKQWGGCKDWNTVGEPEILFLPID